MVQAKDIPDVAILEIVARKTSTRMPDSSHDYPFATMFDVEPHFSDWPWKVVHAKVRALIRRGLLDGCDCGCRGDWSLTEKGRVFLAQAEPAATAG